MISVKSLSTLEQLKDVQKLERVIWGMDPLPVHQTFTAAKNGGIILGAYLHGEIVGFSYGFPGYRDGRTYLCSHMLGIHPHHQKSGIGRLLKEKQREVARDEGYDLITWTFDPLLSVNAYLNLHHLRGIAAEYTENLYGEMDDQLNQGIPSDRFTVEWWIDSKHLDGALTIDFSEPIIDQANIDEVLAGKACLVQIPADFQSVKREDPEQALEWRLETRAIFQRLLRAGFVGMDLKREGESSYYLFVKKDRLQLPEGSGYGHSVKESDLS